MINPPLQNSIFSKRLFLNFLICLLASISAYPVAYMPSPGSDNEGIANDRATANVALEARRLGLAYRKSDTFQGVESGFYAIAGVYGDKENAKRFISELQAKGLTPGILHDTQKNLEYIFVEESRHWENLLQSCQGKFRNRFTGKVWILEVANEMHLRKETGTMAGKGPVKKQAGIPFAIRAKSMKVGYRLINQIPGVQDGFYLIAGVFGSDENAAAFAKKLKIQGLAAGIIREAATNMNYVYLHSTFDGNQALALSQNGLGGSYNAKTWVLQIGDRNSLTPAAKEDSAIQESGMRLFTDSDKPSADPAKKPAFALNLNKLVEKADLYFRKMRYAEAADLYEQALSRMENPSYEVIRKAGDSHYFNTNMDRACYWYDQLFDNYRDEMDADNLFKYAHSLKGTGRYGRAKRLMRLYSKKMESEASNIPAPVSNPDTREAILDNILSTEEQVSIKNLGINSKYSDFAPMFFENDKMVFASSVDSAFFVTRRYKWNNQPFLDLYVAKLNEESQEVDQPISFSKKVNSKYHEAGVTFSPDNNTMYFTRNNYGKKLRRDKNGVNHLKIYQSKKVGDEWSEAEELPFNSDTYSTGHPALSPDGRQMYFVSDMPGSIGGTDIFVVDVHEDGSFSEPRNLGPEINTERKEMFPFINEQKLYFSSDGHAGLGGLDIFEVAFNDTDGFLEVRNLGRPINSNKDDFSFIVNEQTQKGFFASNRSGGKGDDDIYGFQRLLVEETNANAIAGVILDMVNGEVLPEALVELLDENNRKLKEIVTGVDGSFVFEDLEGITKYVIRTQKADFDTNQLEVRTRENETINMQIAMQRLDERIIVENGVKKLKTDMIYFDFDKWNIRSDAAAELDKLVGVMTEYPSMVIKIESHTDSRGPAVYNKYLSDRRAKSTREYLINHGISAERIESATGYGEEQLLNKCDGSVRCPEAQHQPNRRSEFIVVKM